MNMEQNRLATFSPISDFLSSEIAAVLASAGFYATRNDCEVQCYWCLEKFLNWQPDADPLRAHKADCPFILNPRISGNIPISSDIDFQDESMRLETYENWPLTFISPAELAKAGFYFIHRSDQVKCAWCQGVIGQWEIGDNPTLEHLKFFPACPKARSFNHATLNAETISAAVPAKLPKAMQFVTLEARIASFENWVLGDIQNPECLAEAGFYYLGQEDEVRCFHCDGGLRSWLQEDEPWKEHARWFPKCPFLLLTKGHEFVRQIQQETQSSQCHQMNKNSTSTAAIQQTTVAATATTQALTLDQAMSSDAVQVCLQMGLAIGRIRQLVKRKLETTGTSYTSPQVLAEAVLDDQMRNECETDDEDDSRSSMRNTVSSLLWSAIQQSTASTSNEPAPRSQVATTVAHVEVIKEKEEKAKPVKKESTKKVADQEDGLCDPKDLVEENKRLRDARECKICMNNEIGVVFIPCGHLVTCIQCAVACISCPICRADIEGQVRTFLV